MAEEIIIEKEFIDAAKAEMAVNPKLQPCQLCIYFDSDKKWCEFYNQPKMLYNYGSNCFVTNEIALKALMIQERKRSLERKAQMQRKMDVMEALINGADLVRDDILDMLEKDYKRLDVKAKSDDEIYHRSKKNLERLRKAYAEMKVSMQNVEIQYKRYCEYWHQFMFADDNGVYNQEYDKYKCNAGFLTYCFFILDDAMYESEENVEIFIDFLNGLTKKRPGVLQEKDLKRYLIKV